MLNRVLSVIAFLVFIGFGLMGLYIGLFNGKFDFLPTAAGLIFSVIGVLCLVRTLSGKECTGGNYGSIPLDEPSDFGTIEVNPANGLPMLEGGAFDVAGNVWGEDGS